MFTNYKEKYTRNAYFAGGCFWCLQPVYDQISGVLKTTVGYMGDTEETANYQMVSQGITKHRECIQITYDCNLVPYKMLVTAFWMSIDPTDSGGQFSDRGPHYKTAIFYNDAEELAIAEKAKLSLRLENVYNAPIVTEMIPASQFYAAEESHQGYYQKFFSGYINYKEASGRGPFLRKMWPDD